MYNSYETNYYMTITRILFYKNNKLESNNYIKYKWQERIDIIQFNGLSIQFFANFKNTWHNHEEKSKPKENSYTKQQDFILTISFNPLTSVAARHTEFFVAVLVFVWWSPFSNPALWIHLNKYTRNMFNQCVVFQAKKSPRPIMLNFWN